MLRSRRRCKRSSKTAAPDGPRWLVGSLRGFLGGSGEQDGRKVHTDMEMWSEIRRRVLVEGVSKRQIRREYRIGSETRAKMLANPEPPGYRLTAARSRPKLGAFTAVIDEILISDLDAP